MKYNIVMPKLLSKNLKNESGFTIMELMVTVFILAMVYGLVVVNFNLWRGPQFVKLGGAELATNIYKARSYSLSARNIEGNPARLYIVQLKTTDGENSTYSLSGVASDDSGNNLFYPNLESFHFPGTAYVGDLSYTPLDGAPQSTDCLQIAFVLPFGKTYVDGSCQLLNEDPLVNPLYSLKDLDALANSRAAVSLSWQGGSQSREVALDGISGQVTSFDPIECDVWPRGTGDGLVTQEDVDLVSAFSVGSLIPVSGLEYQKADCGPMSTLGSGGIITTADSTQAVRYMNGADPLKKAGGPRSAY